MPKKPPVTDDELRVIANYLSDPRTAPDFHAELKVQHQERFVSQYLQSTEGEHPPVPNRSGPYVILDPNTNKQGIQLRVYFTEVPPVPLEVSNLITDRSKWHGRPDCARINHSELMHQLFACGFVLGQVQNSERIREMIRRRSF